MSELPESWAVSAFGVLNEFTSETINPANRPNDGFELYSVPSFFSGLPDYTVGGAVGSTKQIVTPGDVLVCKINPRINRVWTVRSKGDYEQIASSEWIGFRSPAVVPSFANYYFRSANFRELLCSEVAGVGGSLTRAQPKKVATYPIPIAPINEQIRIASQLDILLTRVQACNDRINRIPALLKRFRQAVLDAATSGALTKDCQFATPAHWRSVQLVDVASDFSYGSAAKSAKVGTVPVLRMGNIQNGRLDWSNLVYTSDPSEIEKYKLTKGDVLFNRTNSPELVGKTAVYKGERDAIYAGYLIRVRCLPTLLPEYLNYCLGSKAGRAYCWSVKSDGVSQSNINAKKLAAFRFSLPSIEEQTKIVRRVETLFELANSLEARYVAAHAFAQRLEPLLLAKAFRGQLMAQDPNDEPANQLLERISLQMERQRVQKQNGRASKENSMKIPSSISLSEIVNQMEEDSFTFEQLREAASTDYESLKDQLFVILADSKSGLTQVFDAETQSIKFKKVPK